MRGGGRILLTFLISARIGVYQHTLYATSKAAVSAMALNLAPELAERGIAINAIASGAPPPTWPPQSSPPHRARTARRPRRCGHHIESEPAQPGIVAIGACCGGALG
jgi:NAD(P)-dependent dehydrogenase (short-subunit alcohol dehydrogenase family)